MYDLFEAIIYISYIYLSTPGNSKQNHSDHPAASTTPLHGHPPVTASYIILPGTRPGDAMSVILVVNPAYIFNPLQSTISDTRPPFLPTSFSERALQVNAFHIYALLIVVTHKYAFRCKHYALEATRTH